MMIGDDEQAMGGGTAPSTTFFAPAERAREEDVRRAARFCLENPVTRALLDAFSGYVLLLNERRQVVAANTEVLLALEANDQRRLEGLRPGEVFCCVHAAEGPGGCGTSKACAHCGAVLTILSAQLDHAAAGGECRMTIDRGGVRGAAEFRVRCTPIEIAGQRLLAFVLQDISAAKRRDVLESVFLRHLVGALGGLKGVARRLTDDDPAAREAAAESVLGLTARLATEVMSHHAIVLAEAGTLALERRPVDPAALLRDVERVATLGAEAEGRTLVVEASSDARIQTDPTLAARVLLDMVRNALEATPPGGTARASYDVEGGRPTFTVRNEGEIPREIAERIFERSFSTKSAKGRGLGAYAMKLLGERLLGGEVWFETSAAEGTSFRFALPPETLAAAEEETGEAPAPRGPAPIPLSVSTRVRGTDREAADADAGDEAADEAETGGTLLVANADAASREILAAVLRDEYVVAEAAAGPDALRIAQSLQPDLILLDLALPGMDGVEVCSRLARDPATARIPVIFVARGAGPDDQAYALQAGAIDFISSPISPLLVRLRVRNHLALKRARDLLLAQSLVDGLTGVANRRRFDAQLARAWRAARRGHRHLALAMIDVDYFKRFNDRYGHARGDECLKAVARALAGAAKRPHDLVARYGGEEFVCIMPETDAAGALEVARRFLDAVVALDLPHEDAPEGRVSVSVGVAAMRPDAVHDSEELVRRADAALYRAKAAGRNRVVPAEGTTPAE